MIAPERLASDTRVPARPSATGTKDRRLSQLAGAVSAALASLLARTSFALYVEAGRELRLVLCEGDAWTDARPRLAWGEAHVLAEAWRTGELATACHRLGPTEVVAAPLVADGQIVAVLGLLRERETFATSELDTVRSLSSLLGEAVQAARFADEERRSTRVLGQLRRAALAFAGCSEVGSLLRVVAREVRLLCGTRVGGVGLVTEDGFGAWAASTEAGENGSGPPPVSLLAQGVGGPACSSADRFPAMRVVPTGHPPVEELVSAPLLSPEGETVAVVYAATAPGDDPLEPGLVQSLQLLAEQASAVLRLVSSRERLSAELAERDRTAASLRRSEQVLTDAQELAGLGSWSWDLATDRIDCTPGLLRVLDRRRDLAPADLEQLLSLVHPADRSRLSAAIVRAVSGEPGARFSLEHRALGTKGEVRRVRSEGMVRVENGRPVQVLGTMLDITAQHAAQEQQRETAESLRLMLEQAPIGAAMLSIDGRFERVNPALATMLGANPEELLGRQVREVSHPDDRRADADLLGSLLAGLADRAQRHRRFVRLDGGTIEAATHIALVRDSAGRPVHFVVQVEELTGERRDRPVLREAETRAREVLEQLPLGVFVESRGVCVYANNAFARMRGGRDTQALVGAEVASFVPAQDRGRLAEHGREATRRHGSPAPVLLRLLRLDGTTAEIELSAMTMRFGDSEALLTVVRDRSEESRTARERDAQLRRLAQENRWLESALERIPVAVVLTTAEGRRARGNHAAEELLGRPIDPSRGPEQIAGQICDETGAPLPAHDLPSTRAARGEAVGPSEHVIRRTDGRLVRSRVTGAPVHDESGALLGGVAIYEDVTRERDLLRAREEWITVVSHDLRQPVTVILAYAELLSRTSQDQGVAARLRHVMASARRLERMIADLLDMSRLEAHGLQLHREPVKTQALLGAVAERLKPSLRGRELQVSIGDHLPDVYADPARVEQVLENLLTNAAKYGANGRPIVLQAEASESGLLVTVENEGEGIAPEQVPLLFRRFHRAVSGATAAVQGLGLGLYIAHGLVEAHGGRIWAESERGAKTRFSVWLPAMVPDECP